ncbi:hypothetical protein DAI22_01g462150 [Oryza sativa Japonica Group]|nr:hypothetical protein DAI22_01g462150 [Oryza sativa Japonica Group]
MLDKGSSSRARFRHSPAAAADVGTLRHCLPGPTFLSAFPPATEEKREKPLKTLLTRLTSPIAGERQARREPAAAAAAAAIRTRSSPAHFSWLEAPPPPLPPPRVPG